MEAPSRLAVATGEGAEGTHLRKAWTRDRRSGIEARLGIALQRDMRDDATH